VDTEDFDGRIRLFSAPLITAERLETIGNVSYEGEDLTIYQYRVTINIPCKMLQKDTHGFYCQIYDQPRPWCCEHYPYPHQPNECPSPS